MNSTIWVGIREYIAAEIDLAVCRHERLRHGLEPVEQRAWDEKIARLETASTRIETDIRERVEALEAAANRRREAKTRSRRMGY